MGWGNENIHCYIIERKIAKNPFSTIIDLYNKAGIFHFFRFYSVGKLDDKDMVNYLTTHALMYEYYRQAQEIVPPHISKALHRLFSSEAFQIVNKRWRCLRYIFLSGRYKYFFYICTDLNTRFFYDNNASMNLNLRKYVNWYWKYSRENSDFIFIISSFLD